jgi:FMN phosphatase YigB (HAD superfamily)
MSIEGIEALTFDTGGTILDWHTGIRDALAAESCGFKAAFVRRPDEWGAEGPPDPEPNPHHDIVAESFPDLARQLGVSM